MRFDQFATSAKMRDSIRRITSEEMESERPAPKYGTVLDHDIAGHKITVLFNGDTEPVEVMADNGVFPDFWGQHTIDGPPPIVEVCGKPGNYYVTRVINTSQLLYQPALYNPSIRGGNDGDYIFAQTYTWQLLAHTFPGGSTRFATFKCLEESRYHSTAMIEVSITTQPNYSSTERLDGAVKKYRFPISYHGTQGMWFRVAPIMDFQEYGVDWNNEFDLNVKINGDITELRIRNVSYQSVFTFWAELKINGTDWQLIDNVGSDTQFNTPYQNWYWPIGETEWIEMELANDANWNNPYGIYYRLHKGIMELKGMVERTQGVSGGTWSTSGTTMVGSSDIPVRKNVDGYHTMVTTATPDGGDISLGVLSLRDSGILQVKSAVSALRPWVQLDGISFPFDSIVEPIILGPA